MLALTFFGILLLFLSVFLCTLLLVTRPSAEAQRMLSLVHTTRQQHHQTTLHERLTALLRGLGVQMRRRLGFSENLKLKKRLSEAGLRDTYAADYFFAAQTLCLLAGAALGSFIPVNTAFWIFAGLVVGYMAPDVWLTARGKGRSERIRRSIPDAIDLLVICVDAGLGLDQSLLRLSEDLSISHPELNEEFTRLSLERRAGTPRIEAWRSLADRTGIDELSSFVTMLAETDRFGTPIVQALSTFAEETRLKRRQRAEEVAAKSKVKILFPLVLCIFPCIFIVLLAPAMMSVGAAFANLGK